jgi:hypothetical protein
MRKRRQTNADSGAPSLRSTVATATEPVREVAWAVEERLVWRGSDLARAGAEAARWPFERIAWAVERRLIWPLRERTAGWGQPNRAGGAAALTAVAVAAAVLGISLASGGSGGKQVAATTPPALAVPSPAPTTEAPSGPVLKGSPPVFRAKAGVDAAKPTSTGEAAVADTATAAATAATDQASAATSSEKPVPAGPAAMKVARRFVEAFVFYEIGERSARAATVFEETATPHLATALAERPPRLPENTKVPRARVLNLVPGPRHGATYTVSASMLRVGVTSELRLEMKKANGNWLITDVRG